MSVLCPHCQAENPDGAQFCGSCGKAVPTGKSGPRVVDATSGDAATMLGREAQVVELKAVMKKSFGALLGVGILQLLIGAFFFFAMRNEPGGPLTGAIMGGVGAIFIGLAVWARSSPLPAAIVGLSIYGSLLLVDAIFDPASLARGVIIKIIIIGMLVQAIQAGMKYKKLSGGTA